MIPPPSISVVWTSVGGRLPHLVEFRRHNPSTEVFIDPAPRLKGKALTEGWRNADRRWLHWWQKHRDACTASHILFLEWDVRFAAKLSESIPIPGDFLCPEVQPRGSDWPWWQEIGRLPSSLKEHATGIAPLAAILLSRRALDAILAHPACGPALAADIFCELRLPTLATAAGFPPRAHSALANVRFTGCDPHAAIAHPVKV